MTWFDRVQPAAADAAATLTRQGWPVLFGSAGETGAPIKTPQPARSEFLENRALGDWAEQLLARSIRAAGWAATHYGASDDIQSDEEGFAEFFRAQVQDVRAHGKRPDLLVGAAEVEWPLSVSMLAQEQRDACVAQALASVEVRASRYKAQKYMAVKQQRKEDGGKSVGQMAPNFTVKVEDLVILYRWIERKRLPQAYVQVFYDSAFGLNVLRIFELIAQWPRGLKLEKPQKSQGKPTIFIPITLGTQVGEMVSAPSFSAGVKETPLGQINAYVKPEGGVLRLDRDPFLRTLLGQ